MGWDQATVAAVKSSFLVDVIMVGQEGMPIEEETEWDDYRS